jgi:vacuolar-type H+-ATPase subunit E/Vma4
MTTSHELATSILDDARTTSLRMEEEGREEAARIDEETRRLAAALRAKQEAMALHAQQDAAARDLARRANLAEQERLHAQQALIDETFEEAAHALATLPAAKRKRCLRALYNEASAHLDVARIQAGRKDAEHLRGIAGRGIAITVMQSDGFIASNADRTERVDYRFATLLSRKREALLPEIASILFGGRTKSDATAASKISTKETGTKRIETKRIGTKRSRVKKTAARGRR